MKNTATKITLATVKSFIGRNVGDILIKTTSRFDGMVDCVMSVEDKGFSRPDVSKFDMANETWLGIQGVWFVRGSRDYFTLINSPEWTGFHVYNCVGTWEVVVPSKSQAASRLRVKLGVTPPPMPLTPQEIELNQAADYLLSIGAI